MKGTLFVLLIWFTGVFPAYDWHKERHQAALFKQCGNRDWKERDRNYCLFGALWWPVTIPIEKLRDAIGNSEAPADW